MNLQSLTANRKLHGKTNFRGLPISIENRKGSLRQGTAKNGKRWQTFIRSPYGYLRGTEGVDGDAVDVFVGPNLDAPNVYIVHTQEPTTGIYSEDKCMLGFMTAPEAKLEFLRNYDSPGHFQSMDTIPFEEFRERVLDGEMKRKKIEAFGTSEGVKKEWDTRGRGRKTWDEKLLPPKINWKVPAKTQKVFDKYGVKVQQVDVHKLVPSEYRKWGDVYYGRADKKYINTIRQAMRQGKEIYPVEVQPSKRGGGLFDVGDGHHRVLAAMLNGNKSVTVMIPPKKFSDAAFEEMLVATPKSKYKFIKAAAGISIGDEVVVNGINYRWVVKGFRGKLLVLEKKGQFNEQQPRTILRTARQLTKI